MKYLRATVLTITLGLMLVMSSGVVFAAPVPEDTPATEQSSGLTNPLNSINSLPDFINAILDAVVQLGTILLTFAIVYVGFKFVAAQGNEEEIRSARTALMWTVIGGLVLLGAKTIGLVISATVKGL